MVLGYSVARRFKPAVAALIAVGLGLGTTLLFRGCVEGRIDTFGFVVRTSDTYFLILTPKGVLYLKSELNPGIGSILKVSGVGKPLIFFKFDGDFDFAEYLGRRGCFTELSDPIVTEKLLIPNISGAYRDWCLQGLDGENRALVSSFLFAKGSGGIENYDQLQRGGVARFLTGTSLHLSFVINSVDKFFNRRGKKGIKNLVSPALALFLCFTSDFSLSGKRVFLLALTRTIESQGRGFRDRAEAQACGGAILLLTCPFGVNDPAFYFPFMMILLSTCTRRFTKDLRRPWKKLVPPVLSFLFLLPPLLVEDGAFNILSALLAVVMVFPSCLLYVAFIPLYILPFCSVYAGPLAGLYLKLLRAVGGVGVLDYGGVGWVFIALWYLAFLIFFCRLALGIDKSWKLLIALPVLLVATPIVGMLPREEVVFIDVGQGDSTLVISNGSAVLIDTGGSRYDNLATECLIPLLKRKRITYLDGVILTHDDFDHCGALDSLIQNFPVGQVIWGEEVFGEFRVGNIDFTDHSDFVSKGDDDNSGSAVLSFTVGKKDFLIMGDAPMEVEKKLIQRGENLKADVLRIGHHGSKTSTSDELLDAVFPDLAVISCGKNYYGHPTDEVLNRIQEHGIDLWRTDLDGTLDMKC